MKILVIDGQGGKIGASIIADLKKKLSENHEIIALGTNAAATTAMMRAGASCGATGENPVIVQTKKADLIVGTIGIIIADALMGEITPQMAAAVGQSDAPKILIPFHRCKTFIAGTDGLSLSDLVSGAVAKVIEFTEKET